MELGIKKGSKVQRLKGLREKVKFENSQKVKTESPLLVKEG